LNTSLNEEIVLYSPAFLKHNYHVGLIKEYHLKLDVCQFRLKFNPLFWNSIWFFAIEELAYDFFVPYEEEVDSLILKSKNKNTKYSETGHISIENEKVVYKAKQKLNEPKIKLINNSSFQSKENTKKSSNAIENTNNNNSNNSNLNNSSSKNVDRKINFVPKSNNNNYKFAVKGDSNKCSLTGNNIKLDSSAANNSNNKIKFDSNKKVSNKTRVASSISPLKINFNQYSNKNINEFSSQNQENNKNSNSFETKKEINFVKNAIKNSSYSNNQSFCSKNVSSPDSNKKVTKKIEVKLKPKRITSFKSFKSMKSIPDLSPSTSFLIRSNLTPLFSNDGEDTQEFISSSPINKVKMFKTRSFIQEKNIYGNNSNKYQYISSMSLKNYYTGEVELSKGREFISSSLLISHNLEEKRGFNFKDAYNKNEKKEFFNKKNYDNQNANEENNSNNNDECDETSKTVLIEIQPTLLFGDNFKNKIQEKNN
jgi:hypothetical protein